MVSNQTHDNGMRPIIKSEGSQDDSRYDDELEEDEGDEEDIADEMEIISTQKTRTLQNKEDRMLDDYEILADKAALLQEDIVEDCTNVSKQGNKGGCSKKGRCATKGLKVSEPMYLEFDDLDRPRGKWRLKYGQHLGFCIRKFNINWNWKDVSEGKRKLMWEDTMNLFHIPDEKRYREKFLSSVAKRFRDFKAKLVSGWITKTRKRSKSEDGKEPPDIWKHIKVKDWRLFQKIKTMSPAKRKRDKAVESAKKNENHHHLGQNDFNTARQIWIKDGFYLGSTRTKATNGTRTGCASDVAIDVNRADDWFCAMHSKEKQTGKYVIKKPKNQEVADKLVSHVLLLSCCSISDLLRISDQLELREKQIQGEFIPQGDKDILYYALGEKEDHPGRAKGLGGVNISVKQAFGDSASRKCGTSKKGKSSEEREAIKNELREELRNEMMSFLRQSSLKLPGDREISPEHPLINQPQPSLPSLVKEEGKTKVHKNDLKQFLESSELSVPIIQIFMRTLRHDLEKAENGPRIGWLCPEATLDTKLLKNAPDAIAYVTEAFLKSDGNKDEFIMAPIYNR
ncbi:hypothetical protein RND81_07G027000 [Saponaria officinalis]|uniref:Transposase n=1 Tax=Saponaria officinalis TaxID=3572 RepID=A0AAW1JPX8_SAPOF